MNFRKSTWKIGTFILVTILVFNPQFMALGLFIDSIGLELFVLLLEVQALAVFGYYFQHWFKPAIKKTYTFIQKIDPYFFVPTKSVILQYPIIMVHAVPGLIILVVGFSYVKFSSVQYS